jgi:hypothetical protein
MPNGGDSATVYRPDSQPTALWNTRICMHPALLGAFQCTITDVAHFGQIPPITDCQLIGCGDATAKTLWAIATEFELMLLFGVS